MTWNRKPTDAHLNAVLSAVLPEYAPLSARQGDTLGTWKAIDSEGNVWLIRYSEPYIDERRHHVVVRAKRMAYKASDAESVAGMAAVSVGSKRKDLFG